MAKELIRYDLSVWGGTPKGVEGAFNQMIARQRHPAYSPYSIHALITHRQFERIKTKAIQAPSGCFVYKGVPFWVMPL